MLNTDAIFTLKLDLSQINIDTMSQHMI